MERVPVAEEDADLITMLGPRRAAWQLIDELPDTTSARRSAHTFWRTAGTARSRSPRTPRRRSCASA